MSNILGNTKYKKVYISGAITGMPNKNKEEFKKYEDKFINLGYEVINPHNIFSDEEVERIESMDISEDEKWCIFLKEDLIQMLKCDFVAVLPNWEHSRGANLEIKTALGVKMPVINAKDLQEIIYKK